MTKELNLIQYQQTRLERKRNPLGQLVKGKKNKATQVTLTKLERKIASFYVELGKRGMAGAKFSALVGACLIVFHFIITGNNKEEALLALRSIAPSETAGDATRAMAANLQELAKCI